MMTYPEALEFLNSLINYEKGFAPYHKAEYQPELAGKMLAESGLDAASAKIVHIAGTKGKGSTSYYTARLIELTERCKVGLYTSPHLFRLNERIKINFRDIEDHSFAGLVDRHMTLS